MTKHNVLVSDAGALPTAATMLGWAATLGKAPGSPAPPYKPVCGKMALIRKQPEAGGNMSAWVDYPSLPSAAGDADHRRSWARPSALMMFEQIVNASKGKQIVMFLDYDGTLSPIVSDPDCAFMSEEMRGVVRDVARYFPTAIVSGRCREKVCSFVRLPELYYAGSHGMDIKSPEECIKGGKSVLFQPAREFLPMMDQVFKKLVSKTKFTPGAKVENNKFCLSVHFRCVEEKRWNALFEQVRSVLLDYPKLNVTRGRKVIEIRPAIEWDKGKAVEFLLESLGFAVSSNVFPVYIGDDRTDEDAFKVLRNRGQGFGILVSKILKETNASFSLQDPSEVMIFLERLVEWKRLSPWILPRPI